MGTGQERPQQGRVQPIEQSVLAHAGTAEEQQGTASVYRSLPTSQKKRLRDPKRHPDWMGRTRKQGGISQGKGNIRRRQWHPLPLCKLSATITSQKMQGYQWQNRLIEMDTIITHLNNTM